MLSLESTSSRMNRVAKQELRFGEFFSLDEMLAAIDGVALQDVDALASRILDEEQLSLLALGPIDRRNLPRELVTR
jgi:predicted Zn-dependent peptidase